MVAPPHRVPKEGGRAGSVEEGELEEHGALEADLGVGLESVLAAGRHTGDFDGASTALEGIETNPLVLYAGSHRLPEGF